MLKMPPLAKIYEAYTCIADKRIKLEENRALVSSSDGKKNYTVKWQGNCYVSNDNASFWQGYPGYPILAVLMLQKRLPFKEEIISLNEDLKYVILHINWHELNLKYKRDYEKAVDEVLSKINYDTNEIKKETEKIYEELKNLPIEIKRKLED